MLTYENFQEHLKVCSLQYNGLPMVTCRYSRDHIVPQFYIETPDNVGLCDETWEAEHNRPAFTPDKYVLQRWDEY